MQRSRRCTFATVAVAIVLGATLARAETGRPATLDGVAFDQRIGASLPLDLVFRDDHAQTVRLGDYFGARPVLLIPAYYKCPMLCTLVLNGVVRALRTLPFDVGTDFTIVTFSFNPAELPTLAAEKKRIHVEQYGRAGAADGWHFLTGEEEAIRQLTAAIGFRYAYDEASEEYAHASGVVVVTPEGRVSHYFYGVEYAPRDLRLALVDASENRLGSVVDQLLLFCFQYDPTTGRYSKVALRAVRLGGIATVLALGVFVVGTLRRDNTRGRGQDTRG
jgi:protein SCO1/2